MLLRLLLWCQPSAARGVWLCATGRVPLSAVDRVFDQAGGVAGFTFEALRVRQRGQRGHLRLWIGVSQYIGTPSVPTPMISMRPKVAMQHTAEEAIRIHTVRARRVDSMPRVLRSERRDSRRLQWMTPVTPTIRTTPAMPSMSCRCVMAGVSVLLSGSRVSGMYCGICFVEYHFTVLAAHYRGGKNNSIL